MELPQISLPNLPTLSLSFLINKLTMFIFLGAFFALYVLVSSVLMYHWSAYGMKSHGILVGRTLFLFVSALLFLVALLALSYF